MKIYLVSKNDKSWPYSWKCTLNELLEFKTWTQLASINVFWGQWDYDTEDNKKELIQYGFPMSEEELKFLEEYLKNIKNEDILIEIMEE